MNLSPATTSFSRIRLFVGLSLASFVLMPATGRAASEIQTWESDDYGQVSERPMCPLFVDVEMGWFHGLALDNQGGLHSWGLDSSSQVSNTPTGTGFTRIAAGNHHSLASRTGQPRRSRA